MKRVPYLNPRLIQRQGLIPPEVAKIISLHELKDELFDKVKKLDPEVLADKLEMRSFVNMLEEIEFDMQKAWKFDVNRDYHTHWYQIPHCKCPYADNLERMGVEQRVIRKDCPCHGEL